MHGGRRRFLRSVERERHIPALALEPVKPAVPGGTFPIWIPAHPAILAGLFSFAPDGAAPSNAALEMWFSRISLAPVTQHSCQPMMMRNFDAEAAQYTSSDTAPVQCSL